MFPARRADYIQYKQEIRVWRCPPAVGDVGPRAMLGYGTVGELTAWIRLVKAKIADREERDWKLRLELKTKLTLYRHIKSKLAQEEYITWLPTWKRKILTTIRAGASKLRIETGRWRREPRERRTCQICVQNSIEDEAHFMLYCPMYHMERNNMFNEIMVGTEGYHDLRMMLHDPNRMLDVLIGHSFLSSSSRNAVCVAVAKYLTQAFKRRKLFEI